MNRKQRRTKTDPLEEMRIMWNALYKLATDNGDTILLPKLRSWHPYVRMRPKADSNRQIYNAIKKCFKTTENEVEADMKRNMENDK